MSLKESLQSTVPDFTKAEIYCAEIGGHITTDRAFIVEIQLLILNILFRDLNIY